MSTTQAQSAKSSKRAPAKKSTPVRKRAPAKKRTSSTRRAKQAAEPEQGPSGSREPRASARADSPEPIPPPSLTETIEETSVAETEGETWSAKVRRYRRRQASVASILDGLFGRLADCSPELWERRAYLMLVGLVYERLALDEDEIPTEELVKLAKVLAENRRIEAKLQQATKDSTPDKEDEAAKGDLPDRFADVVRQVYGTNFQPPDSQTP